jgi:hypothetical protein
MAKRRERGEGSISGPDSDGVYEVRISLGVVDGKRSRVKARMRGTRAQARAKLEELQESYALGRPGATPPTLGAYLDSWLVRRKPTLAAATVRMCESAIANLKPQTIPRASSPRSSHGRSDRRRHARDHGPQKASRV